jgi:hypothetical protein
VVVVFGVTIDVVLVVVTTGGVTGGEVDVVTGGVTTGAADVVLASAVVVVAAARLR